MYGWIAFGILALAVTGVVGWLVWTLIHNPLIR